MSDEQNLLSLIREKFIEPELVSELKQCRLINIPGREIILREGDYIKLIPLVLKGDVRVIRTDESGKEILLYHITDGESCVLTISSTLTNNKSKALAETNENTLAILITPEQVRSWILKYNSFREYVFRLYHQRFSELIDLFDALAFRRVDERLIEKIREKAQSQSSTLIRITHLQLANELGTAREVISRLLKQLEKQGRIKNHRGSIEILSSL
jgi:CRP/FNR family transcriptional regulator, anaerobic regulatory protein